MRNKVLSLGTAIQQHVKQTERMLDIGLMEQSNLLHSLLKARLELGFAACVAQDVIDDAGRMIADGLDQRRRAISLHDRLAAISHGMKIDPKAFGDGGGKDIVAPLTTGLAPVGDADERQAA
ncbi:hypothetical protein [Sphingomonas nostoxanthinifaciens]|uniref:hypothetical protein n=1 Tax=Sphingomonas nostoxanthinifaciens TaxID=2872652 RepID=UPI001CC1CD64|nr:hypothetical protein [Sphingomonas nostoxanthinifaciens]UAK23757.1 hypothetical protein K8P63_15435 [Sphingomonas nostoxanthinifaciens]